MSRNSMPSLAALLGLLAIAGYQNRDKLHDLLKGAAANPSSAGTAATGGGLLGDVIKGVTGIASGAGATSLGGILGDVVDRFRNAGHGAAADSWVSTGANQPVTPAQTEGALGGDLIDILVKQTGLSRQELLSRLSQIVPEAVDKMSPDGKLPPA
jgi:uncharacterized protein YidB (DUF937 family)